MLYFSSINMDGAAEEWFSEGGPVTSQGKNSVTN